MAEGRFLARRVVRVDCIFPASKCGPGPPSRNSSLMLVDRLCFPLRRSVALGCLRAERGLCSSIEPLSVCVSLRGSVPILAQARALRRASRLMTRKRSTEALQKRAEEREDFLRRRRVQRQWDSLEATFSAALLDPRIHRLLPAEAVSEGLASLDTSHHQSGGHAGDLQRRDGGASASSSERCTPQQQCDIGDTLSSLSAEPAVSGCATGLRWDSSWDNWFDECNFDDGGSASGGLGDTDPAGPVCDDSHQDAGSGLCGDGHGHASGSSASACRDAEPHSSA